MKRLPASKKMKAATLDGSAQAVLTGACVVAGFLDFFSSLEKGEETVPAAAKALRNTKKRAKAVRQASEEEE